MLSVFKEGHNAKKATKNICCAKGERAFDHNTVSRHLKTFRLGCKNLDDQEKSDWPKTFDCEAGAPSHRDKSSE